MKKLLAVVLSSLILLAACAATPTDTAPAESPSARAERTEAVTADSAYEEGIAPSSIDATASAPQEKMIERWFLHMETETFEESFEKLQDSIEKYNAYLDGADIHNQTIYDQQRHRTAMLTIRVNAEDTNKLLQEIRGLAHVVNESLSKDNVTMRYADLESRKNMLEAKEVRLTQLLEKAENIEDLIVIENHLSETIAEKEEILGQLQHLDRDIQWQFIDIQLYEVSDYSRIEPMQISFGTRIKNTFSDTFFGFVVFLENLLLAAIRALPYLFLFVLLGIVIAVLWRKNKNRFRFHRPNKANVKTDDALKKQNEQKKDAE